MYKILLIEDDEQINNNISFTLELWKYKVISVANGTDALEVIYNANPDLIICDINLPDISGYEIKSKLNEEKIHIPFIFLTAKNTLPDLRKGMQLGADDYIPKPYNTEDLLRSIKIRFEKLERSKSTLGSNKTDLSDEQTKLGLDNIKFIEAQSEYTYLVLDNGKKKAVRKSLTQWEQELNNDFFRTHNSYIINLNYIKKYEFKKNGAEIYLENETKVFPVSQRRIPEFRKRIII